MAKINQRRKDKDMSKTSIRSLIKRTILQDVTPTSVLTVTVDDNATTEEFNSIVEHISTSDDFKGLAMVVPDNFITNTSALTLGEIKDMIEELIYIKNRIELGSNDEQSDSVNIMEVQ